MGSFRLLQANAFQGQEIFSLFDVRKKKKKKNGCSSLWYVGPMFISKEEKKSY